jgi:hypothetical protein
VLSTLDRKYLQGHKPVRVSMNNLHWTYASKFDCTHNKDLA